MADLPGSQEHYLAQYRAARAGLPGAGLAWLGEARDEGARAFAAAGFPSTGAEDWKYTSVVPLQRTAFVAANGDAEPVPVPATLCADGAPHRAVLVNGRLRPELSELDRLPAGVTVQGFAEAAAAGDPALRETLTTGGDSPFRALNTALAGGGVVVRIGAGMQVEEPIEIVYAATAGEAAWHPRTLVVAEEGSAATVVEHHSGGTAPGFANHALDTLVGEGAVLRHVRVQDEGAAMFHIGTGRVCVQEAGRYDSVTLTRGGRLVRNETRVELLAPLAECSLSGAYMGNGSQHIDNTIRIEHRSPRTRSRQIFKGALDGKARGVFQGTIVVERDAQMTDAHQLHRAILLSDGAEVDAKPELRIFADDVKCGHGATSGRLDPDHVFYLASRGIPEAEAHALLVEAFLAEAIAGVAHDGLRGRLGELVREWMAR